MVLSFCFLLEQPLSTFNCRACGCLDRNLADLTYLEVHMSTVSRRGWVDTRGEPQGQYGSILLLWYCLGYVKMCESCLMPFSSNEMLVVRFGHRMLCFFSFASPGSRLWFGASCFNPTRRLMGTSPGHHCRPGWPFVCQSSHIGNCCVVCWSFHVGHFLCWAWACKGTWSKPYGYKY